MSDRFWYRDPLQLVKPQFFPKGTSCIEWSNVLARWIIAASTILAVVFRSWWPVIAGGLLLLLDIFLSYYLCKNQPQTENEEEENKAYDTKKKNHRHHHHHRHKHQATPQPPSNEQVYSGGQWLQPPGSWGEGGGWATDKPISGDGWATGQSTPHPTVGRGPHPGLPPQPTSAVFDPNANDQNDGWREWDDTEFQTAHPPLPRSKKKRGHIKGVPTDSSVGIEPVGGPPGPDLLSQAEPPSASSYPLYVPQVEEPKQQIRAQQVQDFYAGLYQPLDTKLQERYFKLIPTFNQFGDRDRFIDFLYGKDSLNTNHKDKWTFLSEKYGNTSGFPTMADGMRTS